MNIVFILCILQLHVKLSCDRVSWLFSAVKGYITYATTKLSYIREKRIRNGGTQNEHKPLNSFKKN